MTSERPWRAVAALAAAALFPLSASCIHVGVVTDRPGGAAAMVGTWEGTGVQSPAGVAAETWKIRIVVNTQGDGTVSYPGLACGGALTRVRSRGLAVEYREVISYGQDRCINGGVVTLVPAKGRLFWYWTGEDSEDPEVNASAVLLRVGD